MFFEVLQVFVLKKDFYKDHFLMKRVVISSFCSL